MTDKRITNRQKGLLGPFAARYMRTEQELRGMDGEELKDLLDACRATSETNCWFPIFRAAREIEARVERLLMQKLARPREQTDAPVVAGAPETQTTRPPVKEKEVCEP